MLGAVVRQQFGAGGVAADGVAAEDDLVVLRQHGEGAQVEDLVVQRAEREAVGHHVRPAGLEPLDVRGFEADDVRARLFWLGAAFAPLLASPRFAGGGTFRGGRRDRGGGFLPDLAFGWRCLMRLRG